MEKYNKSVACFCVIATSVFHFNVYSVELDAKGVVDVRITSNNSNRSYTEGGYGKFATKDTELSLSQLGVKLSAKWDSGINANLVLNGYSENGETKAGITEAYIGYKSLPNDSGYRWENRTGFFYPHISLENRRQAWANVDTLNSSTLNTWVGEEIRLLGSELKLTRLGKFHDVDYDVSLAGSLFTNNDPAGALLAWHGWTSSNRQTFLGQQIRLPNLPNLASGRVLEEQSTHSDPFKEIDGRLGYQIQVDWLKHKKGKALFGVYYNRAKPNLIENGDYGWQTRFYYAGLTWRLAKDLTLTSQAMVGHTLMQQTNGKDVVNNKFQNAFVKLSKRNKKHTYTLRLEDFSVSDNDNTLNDNNDESGNAVTLNYTYQLEKDWLLSAEYNWIRSRRHSREYADQDEKLTEKQIQLGVRYFF